ncbi:MAG: hypothetical protein QOK21_2643, partial [Solirubrobacteraceae bacterium]|nr:hypothetical protein [Solirubrobacteraceae bacterium]
MLGLRSNAGAAKPRQRAFAVR